MVHVVDVAIAEIRHVGLELRQDLLRLSFGGGGVSLARLGGGHQLTVLCEIGDGTASAHHLLLGGRLLAAVGTCETTQEIVHAGHVAVGMVCGKDREHLRYGDAERRLHIVFIVGLRERSRQCDDAESLVCATIVEALHGGELHGLSLSDHVSRVVAGEGTEQRSDETDDSSYLDALLGQLRVAVLEQIPGTHGHGEGGTDDPRGRHGMAELIHGEGRESHVGKRGHLEAHGVGVELLTDGILHPGVGDKNPPGRDGGTQAGEPCRSKVEAA